MRRLPLDELVEGIEERACLSHAFGHVQPQAVNLDDPGVRLARQEQRSAAGGPCEEPFRRRGPDDDGQDGVEAVKSVDDGDLPDRVAEAVSGNVEDDGGGARVTSSVTSPVPE